MLILLKSSCVLMSSHLAARSLQLQDNQLCTLKGSLRRCKYLDTLDLANNKLRNLQKLLETLGRFQFLQMLNLMVSAGC